MLLLSRRDFAKSTGIFFTSAFAPIVSLKAFAQTTASISPPLSSEISRPGILLLAHGGSLEWNEVVRHMADEVDLQIPTEVAFGMATRSTMQSAIDRLIARKVTAIVAVPLFVSSHSSIVYSQAYLLGLRAPMPEDLEVFAAMDHGSMDGSMDHMTMHDPALVAAAMKPITSSVPIRMAPALDADPVVADILTDRAASISSDPAHEAVILVAHGPVPDDDNKLWLRDMGAIADQMRAKSHYAGIDYLTLRDDADDPVRSAAAMQLRQKVEQVTKDGDTALVVPLLLSYGGIEDGLRKRLNGLVYRMPAQGLLPDARMVDWVGATARQTLAAVASEK